MTEEFQTGANHIIESLGRFLEYRRACLEFPKALYPQMNDCTEENINRFMFHYLECLIAWEVFESIQISFLPIGPTHEDIYQAFLRTAPVLL